MELNLTQLDVGKALEVTESSVYNWEKSRDKPQVYIVPRIIQFLGYKPDLLPKDTLGQKIVAYRLIRGLTQKELAIKLGIDPSTLSRYERDEKKSVTWLNEKMKTFLNNLENGNQNI